MVLDVERATNCVMQFVDSWTKTCPFAGFPSIYNTQSTRLVDCPICPGCIPISQSIDMPFFILASIQFLAVHLQHVELSCQA